MRTPFIVMFLILGSLRSSSFCAVPPAAQVEGFIKEVAKSEFFLRATRQDVLGEEAAHILETPSVRTLGDSLTKMNLTELRDIVILPRPEKIGGYFLDFEALKLGLERLPPEKYVALIESLLTVEPIAQEPAKKLFFPRAKFTNLITDNWNHADVQRLLTAALRVFANDFQMKAYLNDIRTGKSKQRIDDYRANSGEIVSKPILLGPIAPASAATTNPPAHADISQSTGEKAYHDQIYTPPGDTSDVEAGIPSVWLLVVVAATAGAVWAFRRKSK